MSDGAGEVEPVAAPEVKFRVGRVLARSFSILFKNIVPFGLISIILVGIQFGVEILLFGSSVTVQNMSGELGTAAPIGAQFAVNLLAGMLVYFLLQAALVYGTIMELRGARAGIGECIANGIRHLFPVIVVGVLVTVIVSVGAVLLIIPGILFLLWYWVAVPVAVVERPGIVASLKRSAELTKGSRWKLFALMLIVVPVLAYAVNSIVGFSIAAISPSETVVVGVVLVITTLQLAFQSIVNAVTYHDLRIVNEGASGEEIAAVFD